MARLLAPADAKLLGLDSALPDTALQAVIDGAEAYLVSMAGPHCDPEITLPGGGDAPITLRQYHTLPGKELYLQRAARSVISISNEDETVIPQSEYALDPGGYIIRSVNGNFAVPLITLTAPVLNTAQRRLALLELVKLSLAWDGYASADYEGLSYQWSNRQAAIVAPLRSAGVV